MVESKIPLKHDLVIFLVIVFALELLFSFFSFFVLSIFGCRIVVA